MFTMKGTNSQGADGSATAKIDYVELPLLARVEIPVPAGVKPFVYGGPGFAYRTSCTIAGHSTVPRAQGVTDSPDFNFDCDELARQGQIASPGVKYNRTDVDGIVGGGLAFDVAGRRMTVSARYDVGFVKFLSDGDAKNRVWSFLGTLEWPFHT
jgi:hypothetical protein